MRIAILTIGSRGDVQPYVSLGQSLKSRGHGVILITGEGMGEVVREAGLEYGPIGFNFQQLISDPETKAALRSVPALIRAFGKAGDMVDISLRDSWTYAQDADAILYHPKAIAAPHIAERLGCPAVLAPVVPFGVNTDAFESPLVPLPPLGRMMNRFSHRVVAFASRQGFGAKIRSFRHGILRLSDSGAKYTNVLKIAGKPVPKVFGFSRHLVPMPSDTEDEVTTGYWFDKARDSGAADADLAHFLRSGDAPLYFGFGSMGGEAPEQTAEEIVSALSTLGMRGILARGWGGLDLHNPPEHIHVIDQAPHSWLFPQCAAVIHHGGAGTTHEGLRWGRPTLIRPVFGDQPFWGRRVANAQAGPPAVKEKEFHGETLRSGLECLLTERHRVAAGRLADGMADEPGADGAAEAVERMISR